MKQNFSTKNLTIAMTTVIVIEISITRQGSHIVAEMKFLCYDFFYVFEDKN